MASMLGADPAQLRELAAEAGRGQESLERTAAMISSALKTVRWHGDDAVQFRSDWDSEHRATLRKVARILDRMAQEVRRQAQEQENTSGMGSGDFKPSLIAVDPLQSRIIKCEVVPKR